jgi:hypothetical protein
LPFKSARVDDDRRTRQVILLAMRAIALVGHPCRVRMLSP